MEMNNSLWIYTYQYEELKRKGEIIWTGTSAVKFSINDRILLSGVRERGSSKVEDLAVVGVLACKDLKSCGAANGEVEMQLGVIELLRR